MIDKTNNRILFGRDGCLTEEGLGLFIDKSLSDSDLALVKEHAKQCDLCSDALEGSVLFNTADNFHRGVDELKASKAKLFASKTEKSRKLIITVSSIAATLVVLLGVISILKLQHLSEDVFPLPTTTELAIVTKDTSKVTPPTPVEQIAPDNEGTSYKASKMVTKQTPPVPAPNKPLMVEEDIVIEEVVEEIIVEELEFNGIEYDMELEYIALEEEAEFSSEVDDIPMVAAAVEPIVEEEKPERIKRGLVRKEKSSSSGKKDEAYMMAEITPMFQGSGAEAFDRYLADNLSVVIPDSVFVESIVVSFVIDTAGNIDKVRLVSGTSSDELNEYILEFIESSPVWVPGYVAGRPIETERESEIVLDSTNRKDLQ